MEFLQVGRCPIATGDQWRNNFRKNEEMEPKQKQRPVVNMTGNGNKSYAIRKNTA